MDKSTGVLEVGLNDDGEIVVNHPDLKPDENGVGHIVFSSNQARHLARLLEQHADQSDRDARALRDAEARKAAEAIPVDRDCQVLTDGSPVTADHQEINPATGQQKGYVVLCDTERRKGFVRPVRTAYMHVGVEPRMHGHVLIKPGENGCGSRTVMALSIAETYARDPQFYSGTFCVGCGTHRPLTEFVWEGTTEQVGS